MRPTMFSIQAALAVLLLAAPAALAEEVAPATPEAAEMAPASADDGAAAAVVPVEGADGFAPAEMAETAESAASDGMADMTGMADPADMAATPAPDPATDPEAGEAGMAEAAAEAPVPAAPAEDPVLEADADLATDEAVEEAPLDTHPPLGAVGYDSQGRQGRIHIVVGGDTLWDISDAYLATPWVWPSIWHDNGEIENPHRIYPGDRIWITPSEMRRISPEEAAILLSNLPPEPSDPAAQEDLSFDAPEPEPTAPAMMSEPMEYGTVRVSNRESAGLITPQQMEASASIVGREHERLMLSQEDFVHIGLGESDVEPGDQLTVFRTHEKVFDPDTGVLLGYHVEFLGWMEVMESAPETSLARIGMSSDPLEEGDRVLPRERLPAEIPLRMSPDVEGKISFFPQRRVIIGYNDFVYLNRGSVDGLEVGSPLDVYRPGHAAEEEVRSEQVMVPDSVIGRLVVVRTEDESAVAWVMKSRTELALGDRFRGAGQ